MPETAHVRVQVENFQSIALADVRLDGLTVLVWPSDRGKSALVRAIEGALFNMPGEFFVRTGASFAGVTMQLVEGLDANHHLKGHEIVWVKGGGKNLFQVDK